METQTAQTVQTAKEKEKRRMAKLVTLYATIRNINPERASKSISESLNLSHSLTKKLKDKEVPIIVFSLFDKKLSPEENYNNIFKIFPLDVLRDNKDICLEYLEFLKVKDQHWARRSKVTGKIKSQIVSKDPMLLHFLNYKISEIKLRKTLEKHLVKETLESLEKRYSEYVELLELASKKPV